MSGGEQELPGLALDVEALLRVFRTNGVSFVLVGGTALVVHGAIDRVTYDIDVVPAPNEDNLNRLAEALHALDARVITGWDPLSQEMAVERSALAPEVFRDNPFLHLVTSAGRVDVLLAPTGIPGGYDQLIPNASVAMLAGGEVTLASLKDLITMKRAVGRSKDRSDLDQLGGDGTRTSPTFRPPPGPSTGPGREREPREGIDR